MAEDVELGEELEALDGDGEELSAEALAELAAVAAAEVEAESAAMAQVERELAEARSALDAERAALSEAVERYRRALLASAPEVPAELVRGATVDEVEVAFEAAQATVARIRSEVASELGRSQGFPVGSPAREDADFEGLSAAEKIAYGLQLRGRG